MGILIGIDSGGTKYAVSVGREVSAGIEVAARYAFSTLSSPDAAMVETRAAIERLMGPRCLMRSARSSRGSLPCP